jgi:hypothetical protein
VDPTRVQVLDLPRRGKAAALADGAYHATGEILVFTDANTMFEPNALAMLARNFADPDVGGVAGRTQYVVAAEAESAGRGEDLYWRYDTWLKSLETKTGSVVSAHGGMYAIRRALFRPVEDPAVTDDFAISTAIVAQGKRLVFEPAAVGRERTMATLATDRALLLLGVPGTAKTWVSEHLAAAISGVSGRLVQGTAGTPEEAVRYGWNYARLLADGPSRGALVASPVMRAMEEGTIVRIEELTRIPSDVQDALITILS